MTCRLIRLVVCSVVLSIFLSACNNAEKDLRSDLPPKGEMTGKVVDAVLVGSTIQVYEWHQGEIVSNPISETTTDINGHYLLEPSYYDSYLLLKATGVFIEKKPPVFRLIYSPDKNLHHLFNMSLVTLLNLTFLY